MVLPEVKEKEDHYAFQMVKHLNLQAMTVKDFITKFKQDKVFSKRISQQDCKCLVKFELFRSHSFFKELLSKGVPLLPIDTGKVPYALQNRFCDYPSYI